jgi:hypothetical protein
MGQDNFKKETKFRVCCIVSNTKGEILFIKDNVSKTWVLAGGITKGSNTFKTVMNNCLSKQIGMKSEDLEFIGMVNLNDVEMNSIHNREEVYLVYKSQTSREIRVRSNLKWIDIHEIKDYDIDEVWKRCVNMLN